MTSLASARTTLTQGTAVGAGLMAGLFFVFSIAVMPALRRLPARQGVAAMQAINVVIVNPVFLVVFLGTALAAAALAFTTLLSSDRADHWVAAVGAAAYLVGAIAVTAGANVPLNDRLATVDADGPGAPAAWAHYLATWNPWNHARTALCLVALVCLVADARAG